jgi:hypothetical protein
MAKRNNTKTKVKKKSIKTKAKKNNTNTKVESIRHKDKRANIPTEELRDFVSDEELAPKAMLYPRDRSVDPQLVWMGKDEQDREALAVPIVPVYILRRFILMLSSTRCRVSCSRMTISRTCLPTSTVDLRTLIRK